MGKAFKYLNSNDLNALSMKNGSTKTFSRRIESIKNNDDFSAKTVKTGEILNLINGVKRLE